MKKEINTKYSKWYLVRYKERWDILGETFEQAAEKFFKDYQKVYSEYKDTKYTWYVISGDKEILYLDFPEVYAFVAASKAFEVIGDLKDFKRRQKDIPHPKGHHYYAKNKV